MVGQGYLFLTAGDSTKKDQAGSPSEALAQKQAVDLCVFVFVCMSCMCDIALLLFLCFFFFLELIEHPVAKLEQLSKDSHTFEMFDGILSRNGHHNDHHHHHHHSSPLAFTRLHSSILIWVVVSNVFLTFIPKIGEMIQFDYIISFRWVDTTN